MESLFGFELSVLPLSFVTQELSLKRFFHVHHSQSKPMILDAAESKFHMSKRAYRLRYKDSNT